MTESEKFHYYKDCMHRISLVYDEIIECKEIDDEARSRLLLSALSGNLAYVASSCTNNGESFMDGVMQGAKDAFKVYKTATTKDLERMNKQMNRAYKQS